MLLILHERGFNFGRISARPPIGLYCLRNEPKFGGQLSPQRGELAGLDEQDFIAGGKACLPAPLPRHRFRLRCR